MILLDRVSKSYTQRGVALERVSLHVEPKEFVIIVGPSGAGKSTLFKLLTREEKPTSAASIMSTSKTATCRCCAARSA
jgi:cell division transport system ATP-binding protein